MAEGSTAWVAAVDLGASSGRVMLGEVGPDTLELTAAARFPNDPVRDVGGLHWDVDALRGHAVAGLVRAGALADGRLTSVGIDTWAVDYGLVAGDRLVGRPFHYRDEGRGDAGPRAVHERIGRDDLYARNGLQFLPFNTLYQLAADDRLGAADRVLLIPDLFAWWLTGRAVAERTNASTTGLLDVRTREWDLALMARLGLPSDLFPELVDPGDRIGSLLPAVAAALGSTPAVVAVGSHDTASAVVGVPMLGDDAAYISLGTWGLVGLELGEPVLTPAARAANFTNEGGVDGTVRFLTNVMGTFLLSETLRTWRASAGRADLAGLLADAASYDGPITLFDVRDERFLPPNDSTSDMPARIATWCREHHVQAPVGEVAMVRSIVESLAIALAEAVDTAAGLAARPVRTVHVVGGGAQNHLLCQAVADRSGREVLAGPVEATALGNVLVQARAAGAVGPDLSDLRDLVSRTQRVVRFSPRG